MVLPSNCFWKSLSSVAPQLAVVFSSLFKGQPDDELSATSQSLESFSDEHRLHLPPFLPIFHGSPLCNSIHCLEVRKACFPLFSACSGPLQAFLPYRVPIWEICNRYSKSSLQVLSLLYKVDENKTQFLAGAAICLEFAQSVCVWFFFFPWPTKLTFISEFTSRSVLNFYLVY